jgi:methionyl-tRNA formyltransferase
MGTDEISCGFLDALLGAGGVSVRAIVTQPDRPSGRHLKRVLGPVRAMVLERSLSIDVLTPPNVNTPAVLEDLGARRPDAIVVVAYGQFLGKRLLALPRLGCVNLHLSLLPALRGASPITRAILSGLAETGVTAMMMDAGMDSGDILGSCATPIGPDDTYGTLAARLVEQGRELMLATLRALEAGTATRTPQDHAAATFAPKLQKDEWLIDWANPAEAVCRAVRAFNPKPACTTFLPPDPKGGATPNQPGGLLKVLRAVVEGDAPRTTPPGTVVSMQGGPLIAAGDGRCVRMLEVRPEGRPRAMSGADFVNGYRQRVREGDLLFPGLSTAIQGCP